MTTLLFDVKTKAETRALGLLGDALGKAAHETDELGDQAKQSAAALALLDAEINKTKRSANEMARAFAESDDRAGLTKQFNAARRDLTNLRRLRKELEQDLVPDRSDSSDSGRSWATSFVQGAAKVLPLMSSGIEAAFTRWPIGASIATAIVAGAPLIGGAAAAAVIGGASGLGLIGGTILAFRDPALKAAYSHLGSDILESLSRDAQETFVRPLAGAAEQLRGTFQAVEPDLRGIFRDVADKGIAPLTAGADRFIRELVAGLHEATEASGPLFGTLGHEIGELGADLHSMFTLMSHDGVAAGQSIAIIFDVVEVSLGGTIMILSALGKGLEFVTGTLAKMPPWALTFMGAFGMYLADVNDKTKQWAESLPGLTGQLDNTDASVNRLNDELKLAASAFDLFTGKAISSAQAQDAMTLAADALSQSVKENGASLDVATVAGARNRDAYLSGVQAAQAYAQKVLDATGSTEQAVSAYDQAIGSLNSTARAAGLTASQVAALNAQFAQPDVVREYIIRTHFETEGTPPPSFFHGLRRGGVIHAAGGLTTRPGIYPDGAEAIHFAERGTGGELFLPLRGIPQRRAASLLSAGAQAYGMQVVPANRASALATQSSGAQGGGGGRLVLEVAGGGGGSVERLMAEVLYMMVRNGQLRLRAGGDPVTA